MDEKMKRRVARAMLIYVDRVLERVLVLLPNTTRIHEMQRLASAEASELAIWEGV